MILDDGFYTHPKVSIPRESGDDPGPELVSLPPRSYSPRERG